MRSWTRPDGDVDYLLLANVDDDIRAAAFAGRDFARAHLGVEMPPLLFYSAEGLVREGVQAPLQNGLQRSSADRDLSPAFAFDRRTSRTGKGFG
jgi:hypothetical protein